MVIASKTGIFGGFVAAAVASVIGWSGTARADLSTAPSTSTVTPMPVVIVNDVRLAEPVIPSWKNRVSFDPLGLLFGFGNLTYERGFGEHFSAEVTPSFVYWGFGDTKLYGGGLGVGASYYFTGDAPRGFRVTANFTPSFVSAETPSAKTDRTWILRGKALIGYNWIWQSGFTLGLGGGMQYVYGTNKNVKSSLTGVLPTVDFNLGFAF